jgi:hypothetical protein
MADDWVAMMVVEKVGRMVVMTVKMMALVTVVKKAEMKVSMMVGY